MIKRILSRFFGGNSQTPFNIPVLCYHSWTVTGPTYETNDHVALESDLKELGRRGYEILPIGGLVALLRGNIPLSEVAAKKLVCLTCDDGNDFDYHDYVHAEWGDIPSFHSLLVKSKEWLPQFLEGPRAVSFVMASRQLHSALNEATSKELAWSDAWWHECARQGVLGIANHSWDHTHTSLDVVRQCDNEKGSFLKISNFADAEAQIADTQTRLTECIGQNISPFFGYPYGHVAPFLRDEYFPKNAERLGLQAGFSTAGTSVNKESCLWDIPRFVCGNHWRGSKAFSELLDAVEVGEL